MKKWLEPFDWGFVTATNQMMCENKRAHHGPTSDGHALASGEWEIKRQEEMSLAEVIDFCRSCHRMAPFTNFNGNTFWPSRGRSSPTPVLIRWIRRLPAASPGTLWPGSRRKAKSRPSGSFARSWATDSPFYSSPSIRSSSVWRLRIKVASLPSTRISAGRGREL